MGHVHAVLAAHPTALVLRHTMAVNRPLPDCQPGLSKSYLATCCHSTAGHATCNMRIIMGRKLAQISHADAHCCKPPQSICSCCRGKALLAAGEVSVTTCPGPLVQPPSCLQHCCATCWGCRRRQPVLRQSVQTNLSSAGSIECVRSLQSVRQEQGLPRTCAYQLSTASGKVL